MRQEFACRAHLVEAVLEEVENSIGDCDGELERVQEVEKRLLMESCCGTECSHCHEEGEQLVFSVCIDILKEGKSTL